MMTEKIKDNKIISNVLLCLFSLIAGWTNGFMGTGGGIIFVWALSFFTKNDQKDNFATTLCAILPISTVSAIVYMRNGNVDFKLLSVLIVPAILGGISGAFLTDKVNKTILSVAFSLLIIYSGVSLVFR